MIGAPSSELGARPRCYDCRVDLSKRVDASPEPKAEEVEVSAEVERWLRRWWQANSLIEAYDVRAKVRLRCANELPDHRCNRVLAVGSFGPTVPRTWEWGGAPFHVMEKGRAYHVPMLSQAPSTDPRTPSRLRNRNEPRASSRIVVGANGRAFVYDGGPEPFHVFMCHARCGAAYPLLDLPLVERIAELLPTREPRTTKELGRVADLYVTADIPVSRVG